MAENTLRQKVFENLQIRVDKTNRLWYSVLATELDKSNRLAGLRCTRKAGASARASAKPKFVAAGPLHLAYARPLCGLKAPLGLSLLRKRQFLHSILFFSSEVQLSLLCISMRGAGCVWYRTLCKKNKNGTYSLTTCTPRFLFCKLKTQYQMSEFFY